MGDFRHLDALHIVLCYVAEAVEIHTMHLLQNMRSLAAPAVFMVLFLLLWPLTRAKAEKGSDQPAPSASEVVTSTPSSPEHPLPASSSALAPGVTTVKSVGVSDRAASVVARPVPPTASTTLSTADQALIEQLEMLLLFEMLRDFDMFADPDEKP